MPPVRFCSACGAELPSRPPTTCTSCGTSHWLNPWPCANGIVVENERCSSRAALTRRGTACGDRRAASRARRASRRDRRARGARRDGLDVEPPATSAPGSTSTRTTRASRTPVSSTSRTSPRPREGARPVDPAEVSEVAWFGWDELPSDLAPPGTLEAVLGLARSQAAQPPSLTASRATSSGPPSIHWLPAGSSVYALLRKRYAAHRFLRTSNSKIPSVYQVSGFSGWSSTACTYARWALHGIRCRSATRARANSGSAETGLKKRRPERLVVGLLEVSGGQRARRASLRAIGEPREGERDEHDPRERDDPESHERAPSAAPALSSAPLRRARRARPSSVPSPRGSPSCSRRARGRNRRRGPQRARGRHARSAPPSLRSAQTHVASAGQDQERRTARAPRRHHPRAAGEARCAAERRSVRPGESACGRPRRCRHRPLPASAGR